MIVLVSRVLDDVVVGELGDWNREDQLIRIPDIGIQLLQGSEGQSSQGEPIHAIFIGEIPHVFLDYLELQCRWRRGSSHRREFPDTGARMRHHHGQIGRAHV